MTPVLPAVALTPRIGPQTLVSGTECRVGAEGYELVVHVLDAPLEVRRERVQRRNDEKGATFAMVVPDHVFEMASRLWEAPDDVERSEYAVTFVPASSDDG